MPHDHPRLELLKQQASRLGLSRDQVREFGPLTRRATWESAIAFRRATNGELNQWSESEIVDNVIHEPHDTRTSSSLFSFPQLIALFVAVGFFCVFFAPMLRRIPPLFPVKITIQVGK
jgi:hypothetical protein